MTAAPIPARQSLPADDAYRLAEHLFGPLRGVLQDGEIEVRVILEDNPGDKVKPRSRWYSDAASLANDWAALEAMNADGWHVFWGVNRRHGRKRRKADVPVAHCAHYELDAGKDGHPDELLARALGMPIPPTAIVASGSGGLHLYWRLTQDVPGEAVEAINKGIRAHLGATDGIFDRTRILRVPGLVNVKPTVMAPAVLLHCEHRAVDPSRLAETYPEPEQAAPAARHADWPDAPRGTGSATEDRRVERARAWARNTPGAVSGQGGHTHTFTVAMTLVRGFDLRPGDALDIMREWNARCEPPWSDAELARKVEEGAKGGMPIGAKLHDPSRERPVPIARAAQGPPPDWSDVPMPGDEEAPVGYGRGENHTEPPGCGDDRQGPPPPTDRLPATRLKLTDWGNAARLVRLRGHDIRYCYPWGKWLVWDGARWKRDDTGAIMREARVAVADIMAEARKIEERAEGDKNKLAVAAAVAAWGKKSAGSGKMEALVKLAQSEPGVPVRPDDLDADLMTLNVANGTVDLRTGRLRPHRREDHNTKVSPVPYDPDAQCPEWLAFLESTFAGDQDLISFVQRAAGYSLTGDVSEQCLFFLHGGGRNGKGVLMRTLELIAGEYAVGAPPLLLIETRNEQHPTEIAGLQGARLVTASETDKGRKFAEAKLKSLTGGDRLTAHFMGKDNFTFAPQFKIWLASNYKPTIKGTDTGIWRRLRLIPFDVEFHDPDDGPCPPDKALMDKGLEAKLREELPGILAWAIGGAVAWQAIGLRPPKVVMRATEEYRADMDTLGTFLDECCVTDPVFKGNARDIYQRYCKWCADTNEKPVKDKEFAEQMRAKGFDHRRSTGGRYVYGGVDIRREQPDDPRAGE